MIRQFRRHNLFGIFIWVAIAIIVVMTFANVFTSNSSDSYTTGIELNPHGTFGNVQPSSPAFLPVILSRQQQTNIDSSRIAMEAEQRYINLRRQLENGRQNSMPIGVRPPPKVEVPINRTNEYVPKKPVTPTGKGWDASEAYMKKYGLTDSTLGKSLPTRPTTSIKPTTSSPTYRRK